jgi:N-acetylneuraminic acid mutarotase
MTFDFQYVIEGGSRVSHTSLVSDNCVYYLFGEDGKHESRQYLNNVLKYNIMDQTLNTLKMQIGDTIVLPRASHTSTMFCRDKFLCFGGNRGLELLNDCLIGTINPNSEIIQMKKIPQSASSPCHRRGQCVVSLGNDKLFLFGGNGQEYCRNDSYILDVSLDVEYLLLLFLLLRF